MYVPIAVGALGFGRRGGIASGILAGLLLGPLMPADVATGEPQLLWQWTERLLAFVMVGALFGTFVTMLRDRTLHNRWLAFHDPVTGVPNRRALNEMLREHINDPSVSEDRFVLVVASINNYREFLRSFGPGFADSLMVAFIERLKRSIESSVIPCQLSAATVAFPLAVESPDPKQLERALESAKQPFEIHDVPVYADVSLGRAVFPRHAADPEALLRWNDPKLGSISPGQFIPAMEDTHLIHDVTEWVLDASLHHLKRCSDCGIGARVAVNVSARNLANPDFPRLVRTLLETHKIPPDRLELEVTESAVMAEPAEAARFLSAVRDIGVSVAIDDFGTGQTSLSHLSSLPFDVLKVNRFFVQRVPTHAFERQLVAALVNLSWTFEWTVLAEGVEDAATEQALRQIGCDLVQGYYFSKPLSAEDSLHYLSA